MTTTTTTAGGSVCVHVYDLAPELNQKLGRIGLGVYHSGVEVQSGGLCAELWFHGHDEEGLSGVIALEHSVAATMLPLVETIQLGPPGVAPERVKQIVDELTLEFLGPTYHILRRNCNSFCEELVSRLRTRRSVPGWVNRLATAGRFATAIIPEPTLWRLLAKFSGGGNSDADAAQQNQRAVAEGPVVHSPPKQGLTPEMHRCIATESFLSVMLMQQQQQQQILPPHHHQEWPQQPVIPAASTLQPRSSTLVPVPVLVQPQQQQQDTKVNDDKPVEAADHK